MDTDRKHISDLVIDILAELGDAENSMEINGSTNPILDLGLDSLDGVEFACALSEKIGWDIPHEVNPFVDDDGKRARTVDEIVELVVDLSQEEREVSHA